MAQVDYFLKIDGIDGESKDAKHKGEIEIQNFQFGASQRGTSHAGGGSGAGKVIFDDFSFDMPVSKASPKLMLACAGGDHIKTATLTCRKAGKDQQEYLVYQFHDLLVSSFKVVPHPEHTLPWDAITLNFSKFEVTYKEQQSDGTLAGPIKAGWDMKLNKHT